MNRAERRAALRSADRFVSRWDQWLRWEFGDTRANTVIADIIHRWLWRGGKAARREDRRNRARNRGYLEGSHDRRKGGCYEMDYCVYRGRVERVPLSRCPRTWLAKRAYRTAWVEGYMAGLVGLHYEWKEGVK